MLYFYRIYLIVYNFVHFYTVKCVYSRSPQYLTKRSKRDINNNLVEGTDIEKYKASATRHIFLIRHGQYNTDGRNDSERILTELGKEQKTTIIHEPIK